MPQHHPGFLPEKTHLAGEMAEGLKALASKASRWVKSLPRGFKSHSLRHKDHNSKNFTLRRDAREAEEARLESVCAGNCTEGSNPSLSAIIIPNIVLVVLDGELAVLCTCNPL